MQLETSDRISTFGVKPHIKKGYYPAKLLKVEEFKEKDGTLKVGKFGLSLIFEFAIYKKDPDTDAPIEPMMFTPEEGKGSAPVKLSKFVYHKYKVMDKSDKWVDGKFQTAITPNSAVTKVLKSLGWTFSATGVDPDEFVGNWVEVNVDDYVQGEGADKYTASSIKDINPYLGPTVGDVKDVKASEPPKSVSKQLKHVDVEEDKNLDSETQKEILKRVSGIENLQKLFNEGSLSENGMKQATEQLEAEIKVLRAKK